MAMANEHGRYGLPKNYASAIRLYELAMNAGSGVAAFRLGELLLSGEEKSDRDRGETLVEDANRMGVIDAKIELALKTMSAEPKYIPELKRLIGSTMGGTLSPHGEKLMREVLEDPDSHSYQKWMAENWLRERAASS
jgi:TPR repeat protein